MFRLFYQISVALFAIALIGCSKQFQSSSLIQVSLEGFTQSALIDEFRELAPDVKFAELKNTDLIQALLISGDAEQCAEKVNRSVEKLQKEFMERHPTAKFIIWEKAVPDRISK